MSCELAGNEYRFPAYSPSVYGKAQEKKEGDKVSKESCIVCD